MSLYDIIMSLQAAHGSNAKLAILEANKDDELLKAYLKATYDPSISYYQKKAPPMSYSGNETLGVQGIESITHMLSNRVVTGSYAVLWLRAEACDYGAESKHLIKLMISRSVGASVGDTMILKVWPTLYFIPPYMRCSLMDDKVKAKFDKLPRMIVQPKLDGSFMYLIKETNKPAKAVTRAGSVYPQWFADKLAEGYPDDVIGFVAVGECLVHADEAVLDRQTGNGILNSILKSSENEYEHLEFSLTAWDNLSVKEFQDGFSVRPYCDRLSNMGIFHVYFALPHIRVIPSQYVSTLAEAYAIYSKYTQDGLEGAVLKDPASIWKDGTSKWNIKLKIAFEAEYVITGVFEGNGKYVGMLGGYDIETSDGLLKSSVGTGFTDEMRRNPLEIGSIITVIANDVVSRRDSPYKSLFLPVFSEQRMDKTEADSLVRVLEQLNAAKGIL